MAIRNDLDMLQKNFGKDIFAQIEIVDLSYQA